MHRRKKYLIDKAYQLKTTFTVIGIVILLNVIVIITLSSSIMYNDKKINDIISIQSNIVNFLKFRITQNADPEYKMVMDTIAQNHSDNIQVQGNIVKHNRIILASIVIFSIVQCILLYVLLLRKTHHISGPIYLMSLYLKEIIEGKIPTTRPLRKKDELKDFYALFNQMVEKLRSRDKHIS